MVNHDWLNWMLLLMFQNWGITLGAVIVIISVGYHRALVKAEALPVIDNLKEGSKLREMLVMVRNTLFTRLLLESSRTYNQLYDKWLSTSELHKEVFQRLLESTKEPERLLRTIIDLAMERGYRKEFERLLEEGKLHIDEETIEAAKKLYSGIRVVDKLFEAYTHAQHLKSKYNYWPMPVLMFAAIALFVLRIVTDGDYAAIAVSMFIAMVYYGYYSRHVPYVKEAKKHIFEIKAKTDIGEVLRYVTSRTE